MNSLSSIQNIANYSQTSSGGINVNNYRYYLPFENSLVSIPNGTFVSANVTNSGGTVITETYSNSIFAKGAYSLQTNGNSFVNLDRTIITNTSSGAISVWVYLNNLSASTIFGYQVSGQNSIGFLTVSQYNNGGGSATTGTSGKLYFRTRNSGQLYTSNQTLTTGQWYHIVVNWNSNSNVGNFYINNVLDFTTPTVNANDSLILFGWGEC